MNQVKELQPLIVFFDDEENIKIEESKIEESKLKMELMPAIIFEDETKIESKDGHSGQKTMNENENFDQYLEKRRNRILNEKSSINAENEKKLLHLVRSVPELTVYGSAVATNDDKRKATEIVWDLLRKEVIRRVDGQLYKWKEKRYSLLSDDEARTEIYKNVKSDIEAYGGVSIIDQVLRLLKVMPEIEFNGNSNSNLVAFLDGVLNISTNIFLRHSPDYFITSYINTEYLGGYNEECPAFDEYLFQTFGGDLALVQRCLEFMGYYFTNDMNAKIFAVFFGPGDSGKSKFIEYTASFFNPEAISSIDIFELGERFGTYSIVGKKINVSSDLPNSTLSKRGASIIKKLTGGDRLLAEGKGTNRFEFENTCKFVFATNHPIGIAGSDKALINRVLVIPFRITIPKERQDKNLFLRFEVERNAIVKKALNAYFRLRANNYIFQGENSVQFEMGQVIKEEGRPQEEMLSEFIYNCCHITGELQDYVAVNTLHGFYLAYCNEQGYQGIDNTALFSKDFLALCKEEGVKRHKQRIPENDRKPTNIFTGIKICNLIEEA